MILPDEWFECVINPGVNTARPGLYEWRIEGIGSYIGKYTHVRRPLKEYGRNVSRLLDELPYRPKKPDGFRHIHRTLAAYAGKRKITLLILENVEKERIDQREREVIREKGNLNRTIGHP